VCRHLHPDGGAPRVATGDAGVAAVHVTGALVGALHALIEQIDALAGQRPLDALTGGHRGGTPVGLHRLSSVGEHLALGCGVARWIRSRSRPNQR
jgi:hypothetical protein